MVDCDVAAYEIGGAAAALAEHGLPRPSQRYVSKLGCANTRETTLQQERRRQAAQSPAAAAAAAAVAG